MTRPTTSPLRCGPAQSRPPLALLSENNADEVVMPARGDSTTYR